MRTAAIRIILLFLFISLTIVFTSMVQPQAMLLGMEFDVRVINGFRDNSSLPLVIWCSTERGDLGGRALQEGDDFGWTVRIELWGAREYLCTTKWDSRRKSFDAFRAPRDSRRCGLTRKCSWLVRDDGFYFSSDEVNWIKDFSWF
ncbi:PREDICTED: uncharacterized protein LOC104821619 [Tarenaya hassleriana]|uniref:uncharacterized protein LOC104821619 n=1 Tax=Tarenaya hassleriana TaxID=28532 RepID=UPI00053C3668|nr:PREDICTED: uncharacterized protein LOC104821619 [Tarenaya hassleriana]